MKPPPRLATAAEEHAHPHAPAALQAAGRQRPSPLDVWLRMTLRGAYNHATREPMVPELAQMVERLRSGELA